MREPGTHAGQKLPENSETCLSWQTCHVIRNTRSTCSSLFLSASLAASWTLVTSGRCPATARKILHSRKHLLSLVSPTKLSDFPQLNVTQSRAGAGNIELVDD